VLASVQKQTQRRLKSGSKFISQTASALEGAGSIVLPSLYALLNYDFDLRGCERTLLPAKFASVSFGFGFVRVRVLRDFNMPSLVNSPQI